MFLSTHADCALFGAIALFHTDGLCCGQLALGYFVWLLLMEKKRFLILGLLTISAYVLVPRRYVARDERPPLRH